MSILWTKCLTVCAVPSRPIFQKLFLALIRAMPGGNYTSCFLPNLCCCYGIQIARITRIGQLLCAKEPASIHAQVAFLQNPLPILGIGVIGIHVHRDSTPLYYQW